MLPPYCLTTTSTAALLILLSLISYTSALDLPPSNPSPDLLPRAGGSSGSSSGASAGGAAAGAAAAGSRGGSSSSSGGGISSSSGSRGGSNNPSSSSDDGSTGDDGVIDPWNNDPAHAGQGYTEPYNSTGPYGPTTTSSSGSATRTGATIDGGTGASVASTSGGEKVGGKGMAWERGMLAGGLGCVAVWMVGL